MGNKKKVTKKSVKAVKKTVSKKTAKKSGKNSNSSKKISGKKVEVTVDLSTSLGGKGGSEKVKMIAEYEINCRDIELNVRIYSKTGSYVPIYDIYIPSIGSHTNLILEKIRQQLVKSVNLGIVDLTKNQDKQIDEAFRETIVKLVNKYFPTLEEEDRNFFVSYVMLRSVGLGEVEVLMSDNGLEEIAINGAKQAIWVYHRQHGWLETNISLDTEDQVRYFASTIGRKVGRQISVLEPLLDVNLNVGDRVNATLMPISNEGNTITIRKFNATPWTICDFIKAGTITYEAAAMLWHAIQYELSILIAGGTASGKTSMLNILSNFFPPDQRIISIEDTREIRLPDFMHWVPMLTRFPNAEGRGGVSMLNLLQNSLRMRPDRILVGEIRRPAEAEVLFEAIHTGHSVYATIHANTAEECVTRLTSPPINVPKSMLPALSLVVVQFRNRRSGKRRTFQIAEITEKGESNVLYQYDTKKDKLLIDNASKTFIQTISTFTGLSRAQITSQLAEKVKVLKWVVSQNINSIEEVVRVMADFYLQPEVLKKRMK